MRELDPRTDYPLGRHRPDLVRTPSGRELSELDLGSLRDGSLDQADMRASADTLRLQAEIARATGRRQLADNLERAAELVAVPADRILEIYTALRPGRSSPDELEAIAAGLEAEFGATHTASFIREAAAP